MKLFFRAGLFLFVLLGMVSTVFALRLEGPAITAKIVAVEEVDGKEVERIYDVTEVDSKGYISGHAEGTTGGSKNYLFGDIKKIENDIANHVYVVTFNDDKVLKLKFGRMVTHYTSTSFNCKIRNGDKEEEAMLDSLIFKSVEFLPKKEEAKVSN